MTAARAEVGVGAKRAAWARGSMSTAVGAGLGAAPLLALVAALGLLAVAFGDNAARSSSGEAQPLFWGGLVLIYAPIALRLFSRGASRAERLALSILLGGTLYLVKVIYSPTGFTLHDELATWLQTSDLMLTGHPFSANSLVTGYAGFPGLESITASLSMVTGLRIFIAGTIVIGVARLLLMLGLFLFFERASGSSRAAGIGVAVYACNPSFLYFDSQFGYESLALAIAASILLMTLAWTVGRGRLERDRVGAVLAMAMVAATLAVTHHMTSYALTGFLVLWAVVIAVTPKPAAAASSTRGRVPGPPWLGGPALPAILLGGAAVLWFVFEARQVTTAELGDVFKEAAESLFHFVTGQSGSKALFQSAGQTNTTIARVLGVASVVPLLAMLPLGLWRSWRGEWRNPLWRALAIVALFYPATLLLRLTQAGTETSQRASEFVYVGLAFVAGLLLLELPTPTGSWRRASLVASWTALATITFLGGFIIGESPTTRQPGPFIVGGEARAVSPQGVSAARFAAEELPAGSRVVVDRPNSTLVSSYGELERVSGSIDGIPVVRLFFSPTFDAVDQRIVSDDAIDYIVVDRRLSHEVPVGGYYFEGSEARANSYLKPIPVGSLRKFNHVRGLSKIFENGPVAIYDTAGLRSR